MSKLFRYLPILILPLLLFTGASCIHLSVKPTTKVSGGIYKSVDAGQHWIQANGVATQTGTTSLAGIDIKKIVMDPSDSKTVYALTDNGVYVTENNAQFWRILEGLKSVSIADFAIDPQHSCTMYGALQNRILKSTNCGRAFNAVYDDSRSDVRISTIRVHPTITSIIYAGLSSGDLIQSPDSGMSWKTIARFDSLIATMSVNSVNPNHLYAATIEHGLYGSEDTGATWKSLSNNMRTYPKSNQFRGLVFDPSNAQRFLHVSAYGILETTDEGKHWSPINLIASPGEIVIRTLAINPRRAQEFYYATTSTVIHTNDNGAHWETKKLPEGYWPTRLIIDPSDVNTMYLSMVKAQE